jgi:SAM-dependent methyltransferase
MSLDHAINRYGSIAAEIYDIDTPFGRLPDTAFHLAALADVDGPILEPACGSGRTLVPLLEAGHDVWGFDSSPDMLARCRARAEAAGFAANVTQARFDDFAFPQAFAALVVPAGSFTLIEDFGAACSVLRRFRDCLRPGGAAILDIQPLTFLAHAQDDLRHWSAENGDLLTLEGRRTETDWIAQRARTRYRYERWRDGALIESQIEIMAQRYWGADEFALALKEAGFADIRVTGGYDRKRSLRANDRVMTFEAVR